MTRIREEEEVVLRCVGIGNVAKQSQPSCRYGRSDWQLVSSTSSYFLVSHMGYIWYSYNAAEKVPQRRPWYSYFPWGTFWGGIAQLTLLE